MTHRRRQGERPRNARKADRKPFLEVVEPRMLLASSVFTVTNTNDSGVGSFRQAIFDANANPGADSINFNIPSGSLLIQPVQPLPFLTETVAIDATTQPGYTGKPVVTIDGGKMAGTGDGLGFEVGNSSVRGLIVSNFSREGLAFRAGGGNTIAGSMVTGNLDAGIYLNDTGADLVGGTAAADAVVASGNRNVGIEILSGSGGNRIQGSFIGTDATGTTARGNGLDGIWINGSSGNTIGGLAAGAGNVIGGSSEAEVQLTGTGATANLIAGNQIGVGGSGVGSALAPATATLDVGVFVNGAPGNSIGGAVAGAGNLISGLPVGVELVGTTASGNLIAGNGIGTDASGTRSIGNITGVYLNYAGGNTIGGTTNQARNVISGNTQVGIDLEGGGATANLIQGNYIGTDASGVNSLGNGKDGIYLNNAPGNTIGGPAAGAVNVVVGGPEVGIQIAGTGASANLVSGNIIGSNVKGAPAGSDLVGIYLNNTPANTIGGTAAGFGNTITGGSFAAVQQTGAGSINNVIAGNTFLSNPGFVIASTSPASDFVPTKGASANIVTTQAAKTVKTVKVTSIKNAGPVILAVTPVVTNGVITGLTLIFSKSLDAAKAQNVAAYQVTGATVASAAYDSKFQEVTLTFKTPIAASGSYRLTVSGQGKLAVTDDTGHKLFGRKGKAAGNFTATFR